MRKARNKRGKLIRPMSMPPAKKIPDNYVGYTRDGKLVGFEYAPHIVMPVTCIESAYFKEGTDFKDFAENDLPYLVPVIEKMIKEEESW